MTDSFTPKLDILPVSQRRLWSELIDVPDEFTLYGGTAIALHLGHRESVDFDFFGNEAFDPDTMLRTIPFLADGRVTQKSPNTLTVIVDRGGPVQVSFFGVPELKRLRSGHFADGNNLRIASMIDLAGTKTAVVQKRAEVKDYLDIDAMLQSGAIDLAHSLAAGRAIYGKQFNPQLTLKALCYFDDGTVKSLPVEARQRLVNAVRAVDLTHLPILDFLDDHPERGNER